jgi:hypothetical protein
MYEKSKPIMSKISKFKVNSWSALIKCSRSIIIEGKETLIVPIGIHGLKGTKAVLDANDEIMQELGAYDKNKNSQTGTILLIGVGQ